MTLPPLDSHDVETVEAARAVLPNDCCHPRCLNAADHAHHMFRRRRTRGGPANWVRLPDGTVCSNLVPLCAGHHLEVTGDIGGHKAAIRYKDGRFWWVPVHHVGLGPVYDFVAGAPLKWQPTRADLVARKDPEEPCPACGTRPRPKRPRQERKRKIWTVQVPSDEEDGAQVMDDYVEALIPIFNLDPNGGAMTRYHALTRALAFTIVNKDSVPEEAKVQA